MSSGDLPEAPVADSRLSITVGDQTPGGSTEVRLRTEPGCNRFRVQLNSELGHAVISGEPEQTLAACVSSDSNEMDEWLLGSVLGGEPQFVSTEQSKVSLAFGDQVLSLSRE